MGSVNFDVYKTLKYCKRYDSENADHIDDFMQRFGSTNYSAEIILLVILPFHKQRIALQHCHETDFLSLYYGNLVTVIGADRYYLFKLQEAMPEIPGMMREKLDDDSPYVLIFRSGALFERSDKSLRHIITQVFEDDLRSSGDRRDAARKAASVMNMKPGGAYSEVKTEPRCEVFDYPTSHERDLRHFCEAAERANKFVLVFVLSDDLFSPEAASYPEYQKIANDRDRSVWVAVLRFSRQTMMNNFFGVEPEELGAGPGKFRGYMVAIYGRTIVNWRRGIEPEVYSIWLQDHYERELGTGRRLPAPPAPVVVPVASIPQATSQENSECCVLL